MTRLPGTVPVLRRGGPDWPAAPDARAVRVAEALGRELPSDRVRTEIPALEEHAGDGNLDVGLSVPMGADESEPPAACPPPPSR